MTNTQLIQHPQGQCLWVETLYAEVKPVSAQELQICYLLNGELKRLSIPKAKPSNAKDGLWQHTCFEAFIAAPNQTEYVEFNFSPSSEWAAYAFSDYRQQRPYLDSPTPQISIIQSNKNLQLTALIKLPSNLTASPLFVALTAVIEDHHGNLSYWAIHHATENPDFHHPGGRTLFLNPSNLLT